MSPVLGPQPSLSDGAVSLGHFKLEDASVMVVWDRDPEMQRRFDWPETTEMPPEEEHLSRCQNVIRGWWEDWGEGRRFSFAVRDPRSGETIGSCDIHPGEWGWEAAYNTLAAHRGKGYAPRALDLLAGWALANLGIDHVDVSIEEDNAASRRVAEKAGFVEVERFTGEPTGCYGPMLGHIPAMVRYRRSRDDQGSDTPATHPPPNERERA